MILLPAAVDSPVETAPEQAPAPADARLNVLFVCTANICRSPFMEQTARALAGEARITFASTGTHGLVSQPMNPAMAATLEASDPEFRSQAMSRDLVDWADLILTAESSHRSFVMEEHPHALRKVFTLGQFARVAQAEPTLRGRTLIEAAGKGRTPTQPEDDIDDPYRRGDAAARAAAGKMSTMLSVIVKALGEEN